MKKFGETITNARKNKNMTQADLAEIMGVTDKAVSKWERDLSYPDIESISLLASTLNISVEELLNSDNFEKKKEDKDMTKAKNLIPLVLKAVALAMGVATITIPLVDSAAETSMLITLLGIGLACISIAFLSETNNV